MLNLLLRLALRVVPEHRFDARRHLAQPQVRQQLLAVQRVIDKRLARFLGLDRDLVWDALRPTLRVP